MRRTTQALQTAAGALQRISETTPGERGRRATVVALVLRSVQRHVELGEDAGFIRRRAELEVSALGSRSERGLLKRLLQRAAEGRSSEVSDILNEYAAGLAEARRLPEADTVIALALELSPGRADLALHAGRISRLMGDMDRALKLYREARALDVEDGAMARLARIGEAVVSADPESALSRAIREAVTSADGEAAAVGLEERARVRRAAGKRAGAARDLACAAARYRDPVDRARVGHELADLFVAGGDAAATREALLFALETGDRSQREHARSRLHTVARDMQDQVGMRRWRSGRPPALVSLSARAAAGSRGSAAAAVARWRLRIEGLAASSSA
ncbi:MAG: hypothetical protein WD737_05990 [Gemmatimonadota bacterium]